MSSHRWDPVADLLSLQERMNRLFEESLSREGLDGSPLLTGSWTPLADVYETADAFVVQMELPGIDEDDVEIHVAGDQLLVRGERRAEAGVRPERFHRMERSHGSFSRVFTLTQDVDPSRVKAQFADGLLRLELPKVAYRRSSRSRGGRSS
jgi:HSP20 family protein